MYSSTSNGPLNNVVIIHANKELMNTSYVFVLLTFYSCLF